MSARACIYINTNIWYFNANDSLVELHKRQMTLSEHRCRLLANCCSQIAFHFISFYLNSYVTSLKLFQASAQSLHNKFNLKNNLYKWLFPKLGRGKKWKIMDMNGELPAIPLFRWPLLTSLCPSNFFFLMSKSVKVGVMLYV